MKKPNIKILQDFTKQYFKRRCPVVKWKRASQKENWNGLADRKKNIIYLNADICLGDGSFFVGCGCTHKPKGTFKYKPGEKYFHVLLHEIAHFKIRRKPPKEWGILKRRLYKDARQGIESEAIMRKRVGLEPVKLTKKQKEAQILDMVIYVAETALKREKGEKDEYYYGCVEDFKNWLGGGSISEHIEVDDWAREEFKKRRKDIARLLSS